MPWAFFSVSNKDKGIVRLAEFLTDKGWHIIASDGTKDYILKQTRGEVRCSSIEFLTGFPHLFDGRVKSLHPKIIGGIAMRDEDAKEAKRYGIYPIDLVAVNFYPFSEPMEHGVPADECHQYVDVGGPACACAAINNYGRVAIVVDPWDYDRVIDEVGTDGKVSKKTKCMLAVKAMRYVRDYYILPSHWFEAKEAVRNKSYLAVKQE